MSEDKKSDPVVDDKIWLKCNSCKKPIPYGVLYWVCNVSTCNRLRTGLKFCTVTCWDAHLGGMNHRESWAEERKAPTKEEWAVMQAEALEPKKRPRKKEELAPVTAPTPTAGPPRVIVRRKSEE